MTVKNFLNSLNSNGSCNSKFKGIAQFFKLNDSLNDFSQLFLKKKFKHFLENSFKVYLNSSVSLLKSKTCENLIKIVKTAVDFRSRIKVCPNYSTDLIATFKIFLIQLSHPTSSLSLVLASSFSLLAQQWHNLQRHPQLYLPFMKRALIYLRYAK